MRGSDLRAALNLPKGPHKVTVTLLEANGKIKDTETRTVVVNPEVPRTLRVRLSRFRGNLDLETVAGKPAEQQRSARESLDCCPLSLVIASGHRDLRDVDIEPFIRLSPRNSRHQRLPTTSVILLRHSPKERPSGGAASRCACLQLVVPLPITSTCTKRTSSHRSLRESARSQRGSGIIRWPLLAAPTKEWRVLRPPSRCEFEGCAFTPHSQSCSRLWKASCYRQN